MSNLFEFTGEQIERLRADAVDEFRVWLLKTEEVLNVSRETLDAVKKWERVDGTCKPRICASFTEDVNERYACTLPVGHEGCHRDTCYSARRRGTVAEWDRDYFEPRIVKRENS